MAPEADPLTARERGFLDRAISLATHGPAADPNPRVGAVIVAGGRIVGEGFHRGAGSAHAEVVALGGAGDRAAGASAYVSLEPCHHAGRTGPCTRALIDAGITRVVFAAADPNPDAAGGANALRVAGIDVTHAPHPDADELIAPWAHAITHGRPFVTWKVGATLDGRVAASDGSSRWITSPASRAEVHELRARCGAIVVGTGTLLADDPALTVRGEGAADLRQPLRVVVGRRPVPPSATLRTTDGWLHLPTREPRAALDALHDRSIRHVLLEGGPSIAAAWLRAGVIDELIAYIAPTLLGAGTPVIADLGVGRLADAHQLELLSAERIGPDIRAIYRPTLAPAA